MAAIANSLALLRFGHFGFGHLGGRGGSAGFLFVIGLLFAGVLIWALTRPQRRES
ncbi:MAG: hypothetical protein WBE76_23055 [Terracidiphilus sp.]